MRTSLNSTGKLDASLLHGPAFPICTLLTGAHSTALYSSFSNS